MARNRNNDDDSYLHISSRQNLEEQARIANDLSEDIAENFEAQLNSVAERMSRRLQRETQTIENLAQQASRNRHNQPDSSISENFARNILQQTGRGQRYDVNWKSVGATIGKEVAGALSDSFSIYVTKPITSAISDMSSAYESNFTAIAGRMGTMRKETYNIMKSSVQELNDSSYKNAINANKELIPMLRQVAEKGWKGSEAVSIALSNAVDQKIMPWLDTSSEAWNNLQFNLADNNLKTLKAQQLLLQESRAGNKLLQSGVVNQITNDLSPVLSNIDYNTMDKEKLPAQLYNLMESYKQEGYDEQSAYQKAKDTLDVYRNPLNYINSDKANEVLQAREVFYGGDIQDIEKVNSYFTGMAANASNMLAAAEIGTGLGVKTYNGGTRQEDYQQVNRATSAFLEGNYTDLSGASPETYANIVDQAVEKVTATQEYDNRIQNTTTEAMYWTNEIAHGNELLSVIATHVKAIAGALVGKAIGDFFINRFTSGGGSTGGSEGGLFSRTAGRVGRAARSAVGGGARGLASAASHLPGVEATSAGVGSAGLSGALSSIGGGSVAAGTAAVAAPIVAGAAIGGYGIKKGINDIQEGDHEARGIASMAGGAAAAAGGLGVAGGMLAAGAVNAWNPVGWGLLIGGGVTVLATAIHRAATAMNENEKAVEAHSEAIYASYKEEVKQRKLTTQQIIADLKDGNATQQDLLDARTFLVQQGLMTQEDAQSANVDQLTALTTAYLNATNTFDPKDREAMQDKATKLAKGQVNQQADKQFTAMASIDSDDGVNSVLEQAVQESRKKEYDNIIAYENQRKKDIEAAGGTYYPSVQMSNGEGGIWSFEEWISNGASGGQMYGRINLTDTDQGTALVSALSTAISNIADEKKRKKLQKSYDKYSRDGFTVEEYQMLYKDISDAGATTDTWNTANTAAGIDQYAKNASVRSESDISSIWAQYTMLAEELRNKLVALKASGGDPKSLMPLLKEMEALDLPYQDKEEIRNQVEELKTKNINDWLILKGINEADIPKYNVGIDYVPSDRVAKIHEGEAVLARHDAEAYRGMKNALKQVIKLDNERTIQYPEAADTQIANTPNQFNLTEVVEAIAKQTSQLNQTLNAIIQVLQSSARQALDLNATSKASARMVAFNPASANTRNLYSS